MSDSEATVEGLKAVAHPLRYRILAALSGGERNVGEIEEACGIGQPTLSQQLAVLRNAGLVETRKQAKLVFYTVDEERVAALSLALTSLAGGTTATAARDVVRRASPGAANFARLS